MKGLKSNKTRKDDQIKKLRECLVGDPKNLIPVGMELVEDAWLILKNRYGDAARVMTARKMMIENLGKYPRTGSGATLLSRQIKWITDLESTLADIIGEESDQLDRDAYGSDMILLILAYFPHQLQYELQDVLQPAEEDGKMKLCLLIKFLQKLRWKNQGMEKIAEQTGAVGIPANNDASSSDGSEVDSDDLSVDERSEFAGVAVESYTSDADDESCSDDVSDKQHPHEPGGERGHNV